MQKYGNRLGRFCDWIADQRIEVEVEGTLGNFKHGHIQVSYITITLTLTLTLNPYLVFLVNKNEQMNE